MSLENPFGSHGNIPDPIAPKPPERRVVASIRSELPRGAGKRKAIKQEMEVVESVRDEESVQRSYGEYFRKRNPQGALELFRMTGVGVDLDFPVQNNFGGECTLRDLIWDELYGYEEGYEEYEEEGDNGWSSRGVQMAWERLLPWLKVLPNPSQVCQVAERELQDLLEVAKRLGMAELAFDISHAAGFSVEGLEKQVEAEYQGVCAKLLRSGKWLELLHTRESRGRSFDFEPALKKVAQEVVRDVRSRYPEAVVEVLEDILLPPSRDTAEGSLEGAAEHGAAIMEALHHFEEEVAQESDHTGAKMNLRTSLRGRLTQVAYDALPDFFAHPGAQEPYLQAWLQEMLRARLQYSRYLLRDFLTDLRGIGFSWGAHIPIVKSIWEDQKRIHALDEESTLDLFPVWDLQASTSRILEQMSHELIGEDEVGWLGKELLTHLSMDASLLKNQRVEWAVFNLYGEEIRRGGLLDQEPYISLQKIFPLEKDDARVRSVLHSFFVQALEEGNFSNVHKIVEKFGVAPSMADRYLAGAAQRGFMKKLIKDVVDESSDLGHRTQQMKELEKVMDGPLTDPQACADALLHTEMIASNGLRQTIKQLERLKTFFTQNGRPLDFSIQPMQRAVEGLLMKRDNIGIFPLQDLYEVLQEADRAVGFDWRSSARLTTEIRRRIFSEGRYSIITLCHLIRVYKNNKPEPFQLTQAEEKSFLEVCKNTLKEGMGGIKHFNQIILLRALVDGQVNIEPLSSWFRSTYALPFFAAVQLDPNGEIVKAYNLLFHRNAVEEVKSGEFQSKVIKEALDKDRLDFVRKNSTQLGLEDEKRRVEIARDLYLSLPSATDRLWAQLKQMQSAGFDHDDPALEVEVRDAIVKAAKSTPFILEAYNHGWLPRMYKLAPEQIQQSLCREILSLHANTSGLEAIIAVTGKPAWKEDEKSSMQAALLRADYINLERYAQLKKLETILGFPIIRTLTSEERLSWYRAVAVHDIFPFNHPEQRFPNELMEALGVSFRDEALHAAVVKRVEEKARSDWSDFAQGLKKTLAWLVKNGYPQERVNPLVMEVMAGACRLSDFRLFFSLKEAFGFEPPREQTEPLLRRRVMALLRDGKEKELAEFTKASGVSVDQPMVAEVLIGYLASGQLPETFLSIVRQYRLSIEIPQETFAAANFTPRSAALIAQFFLPKDKAERIQALQALVGNGPEWRRVLPELLQLQGPAARHEFCGWGVQLPPLLASLERGYPGYGPGLVEFVKRFGMANLPKLASTVIELKRIQEADGRAPEMTRGVVDGLEQFRAAHGFTWSTADIQANPKMVERVLNDLTEACGVIEQAVSDDRIPDGVEASPLEMELLHSLFPTSGKYHTYLEREQLIGRWRTMVEKAKSKGREATVSVPSGYEQREYVFQPKGSDVGSLLARMKVDGDGEDDKVMIALEKKMEELRRERQAIWTDEPLRTFLAPFEEALKSLAERPLIQDRPQDVVATIVERIEQALERSRAALETLPADVPKAKRSGMERGVAALESDLARFKRLAEPGGDEEALRAERERVVVAIREKRDEFTRSREQGTWSEAEKQAKALSLDDWEKGQMAKLQGLHDLTEEGLAGKTAEQREYGRVQRMTEALRIMLGKRILDIAGPEIRMLSLELMRRESPGHIEAVREAGRAVEGREQRLFESWSTLFREELVEHFFNEEHQHPEVRQHPFSRELYQLLESVWRINGIKDKLRVPPDKKQEPVKPLHPLLDQMRKAEGLTQRMSSLERIASGQAEEVAGERIRFLPVRGLGRILASDISNACYNKHNGQLAENEYPRLNAILYQKEGQKGGYLGATLLIEAEESETPARCLVIRALNPTDSVIKRQFSPDQFVTATIDYAIEVAKNRNLDKVLLCLDHSGGHSTNREEVFNAESDLVRSRGYGFGPELKQTPETNFNEYKIWREGETRVVWDRTKAPKNV
jgi:hypothetical protein